MTGFLLAGAVLKYQGEDSLEFAEKLAQFIAQNRRELGVDQVSLKGDRVSLVIAGNNLFLRPELLGEGLPGFNWLSLWGLYVVKDEHKRGQRWQRLVEWVNSKNATTGFCSFFLDEDGDLGVKGVLPFREEVELEDLEAFFNTFMATVLAVGSMGEEFLR